MEEAEAVELLRGAVEALERLKEDYRGLNPQELLSLCYALMILNHDVIKGGIR